MKAIKCKGILFVGLACLDILASEAAIRYPGYEIASSGTVSDGLTRMGTRNVFVQPVCLIPGAEYEKLRRDVSIFPGAAFVGGPLLKSEAAADRLSDIVLAENPGLPALFAGHGSDHPSGRLYDALGRAIREKSGGRAFLGLLKGKPDFRDALGWIADNRIGRVHIVPLMIGAGKHVEADILGNYNGSWRVRIESAGVEVSSVRRGLIDSPAVREMIFADVSASLDCF